MRQRHLRLLKHLTLRAAARAACSVHLGAFPQTSRRPPLSGMESNALTVTRWERVRPRLPWEQPRTRRPAPDPRTLRTAIPQQLRSRLRLDALDVVAHQIAAAI